jgi:putative glutathione S-transferase
MLKWLPSAFESVLESNDKAKELDLYPEELRQKIDEISPWLQSLICAGVYKAGFAPTQEGYEKGVIPLFAALNQLEELIHSNGGPYILGTKLTQLDLLAYPTIVRFDTVYAQHFKTNLGSIRHDYPVLNNWLKNLYHNVEGFKESTDFKHIKENVSQVPTLVLDAVARVVTDCTLCSVVYQESWRYQPVEHHAVGTVSRRRRGVREGLE